MAIQSINIIGSGNVASFLGWTLKESLDIKSLYSRNALTGKELADSLGAKFVSSLNELPVADLTIIAVADDSIAQVATEIPKNYPVVHTSGSVDSKVFEGFEQFGVFYPLQTLSANRNVNSKEIPFLIEASNESFVAELLELCKSTFSDKTTIADSATRAQIHMAAVLVNNFANHIFLEAEDMLQHANIDLSILHPLMKETVQKAIDLGPLKAQTGPAKRNDQKVIQSQADKISNEDLKELYLLLSKMIGERHANS